MARPGRVLQAGIIIGPGVGIAEDGGNGRAAGAPSIQTGKKLRLVGLLPGRGKLALPRGPAAEKALQRLQIDHKAGGEALQRHADGRRVGLAEDGQPQIFAVGAAHRLAPFRAA